MNPTVDAAIDRPTASPVASIDADIAVFAPGGYDGDPARFARARANLAAMGARVSAAFSDRRHQRFSATDDERLHWLQHLIDDPAVDIAMALRGGYGATRLLPSIDFDAMASTIRRHGKRFVGHSDFTAISLGLLATTGAISFAGPMASYDFGGEAVDAFMAEHFARAMGEARVDVEFATASSSTVSVEGMLWGGNLAMLCSLIGTPWMPAIDGGILFVEDVNEQPYRVERMLIQLQQAGVLDRQALVLVGDVSGYRVADYDRGYDMTDVLVQVRGLTSTPLVDGLPFGHCPRKLTLAVGATAMVDVTEGRCRLRQQWDLSRG